MQLRVIALQVVQTLLSAREAYREWAEVVGFRAVEKDKDKEKDKGLRG